MLAKHIINLDLQLIAAKTKQLLSNPISPFQPALHPPASYQPAENPLATNLPTPQPIQSSDVARILTERPQQI